MKRELEAEKYKELSEFLKSRRAKIKPEQVGLPQSGRRRTPGLRREEVALLAGISLTWYTWLEQGRPIQVSDQVIESLSRTLLLNDEEQIYLHALTNQITRFENNFHDTARPTLQHILDSMKDCPSLITDQFFNVLAWNNAAVILLGDFESMSKRERNIVWAMFTDERFKSLYDSWDKQALGLIGRFRLIRGQNIDNEWLSEFIKDLKGESQEFKNWWSLHDVMNNDDVYKILNHPKLGRLEFEVCNFNMADDSGLKMIVHTPKAGTDTGSKIKEALKSDF